MKIQTVFFSGVLAATVASAGEPLTQSTFTDVIKDVSIVAAATKSATPAKLSDLFKAPDLVRTGADSRAELTAPDNTLTRIGANTVFSFDAAGRTLNLEKGSVLFHAPKGKGGGTIKSGGASAAVLGTTLIVSATADGGFKVVMLEGTGKIQLPNGRTVTLHAGQMVYVMPGGQGFSGVVDIDLAALVAGSQLVNGFSHQLPSWQLIQIAINEQQGGLSSPPVVFLGANGVDEHTTQAGLPPTSDPFNIFNYYYSNQNNFNAAGGTPPPPGWVGPGAGGVVPVTRVLVN